jgi:hypothetical protein
MEPAFGTAERFNSIFDINRSNSDESIISGAILMAMSALPLTAISQVTLASDDRTLVVRKQP